MNEKTNKNPRGAGRVKGKKIGPIKEPTRCYGKRVTEYEAKCLDEYLAELRKNSQNS